MADTSKPLSDSQSLLAPPTPKTVSSKIKPATVVGGLFNAGNATHSPFDMDDELIGQLWAEALYYEQQGDSLFLEGDTAKTAEEIQSQFVETDDRAETVSEYLDKELPTGWQDMTIPERKNYLQTKFLPKRLGDNGGLEQRQFVSVKEIWVECFDNKIGDLRKHDSNEIAGILKSLGWTPTGNPRRIGAYGQQRVYERPAP